MAEASILDSLGNAISDEATAARTLAQDTGATLVAGTHAVAAGVDALITPGKPFADSVVSSFGRNMERFVAPVPQYRTDAYKNMQEFTQQATKSGAVGMKTVANRAGALAEKVLGSKEVGGIVAATVVSLPNLLGGGKSATLKVEELAADAAAGMSTKEQILKHGGWIDKAGNPVAWVSDKEVKLKPGVLPEGLDDDAGITVEAMMGEVVQHDKLFKLHPELKNVHVSVTYTEKGELAHAAYSVNDNTVYVFAPAGSNNKTVVSSLMHEVQHWVQEESNMVRGYNDQLAKPMMESLGLDKTAKDLRDLLDTMDENDPEVANVVAALASIDPTRRYMLNLGEAQGYYTGELPEVVKGVSEEAAAIGAAKREANPNINVANLDEEYAKFEAGTLTLQDIIDNSPALQRPEVLKYITSNPSLFKTKGE